MASKPIAPFAHPILLIVFRNACSRNRLFLQRRSSSPWTCVRVLSFYLPLLGTNIPYSNLMVDTFIANAAPEEYVVPLDVLGTATNALMQSSRHRSQFTRVNAGPLCYLHCQRTPTSAPDEPQVTLHVLFKLLLRVMPYPTQLIRLRRNTSAGVRIDSCSIYVWRTHGFC